MTDILGDIVLPSKYYFAAIIHGFIAYVFTNFMVAGQIYCFSPEM
jgi:hypothetical protein